MRDPIERFCSDVAHLHQVLPNFTETARSEFLAKARWEQPFVDAMTDVSVPTDSLLEMAAEEPFFRYYYYHHFYGLMWEKPIPVRRLEAPSDENSIGELARLVRDKFAYVGRYPNVAKVFTILPNASGCRTIGPIGLVITSIVLEWGRASLNDGLDLATRFRSRTGCFLRSALIFPLIPIDRVRRLKACRC